MSELDGKAFKNRVLEKIKPQKPSPWGLSIGLDHGLINRIFNEEKIPTAKHLLTISRSLGVSVDWLLTGEEPAATTEIVPNCSPEEQAYIKKFVEVLRNPHTKKAIQENIEAFLKVPKPKEEEDPFVQKKKA